MKFRLKIKVYLSPILNILYIILNRSKLKTRNFQNLEQIQMKNYILNPKNYTHPL